MATTRLIPLHAGKGKSVAAALGRAIDYVNNPDKTERGDLVSAYECDPISVDAEFLLSKREYSKLTGRKQGDRDVIAYHLRQSFKPGEIDPETANKIGYDLAMKLTKGRHAFIVATHVDRNHIHSHIIFNSTSLDCDRKFRNFWRSSFVIRRMSDQLCLENGLSIIENPKPSRGHYGQWIDGGKPPTNRDKLRTLIDDSLRDSKSFDEFIDTMKSTGCEVKHGKSFAFKIPSGERFIRCNSLGDDYTEYAIRARISGARVVTSQQKTPAPVASSKPNLLIDIQAKIQQGKGPGYEHWAKIHNLKESAKTLIYLQDNGLLEYDILSEGAAAATKNFNDISEKFKAAEKRLREISELQKNIGVYIKTRDVYKQYREHGYSKKFYAAHESDIILHKSAKKHFDSLGLKKLPTIKMLQQEYAVLDAERKKSYQQYRPAKDEMIALLTAKNNVDRLLGMTYEKRKSRTKIELEL